MNKKKFVLLIKISIAVFLLWHLFRSEFLSGQTFIKLSEPANLSRIALACVFFYLAQLAATFRLFYFLCISNIRIKVSYLFKLTVIGNFFSLVVPGTVGGDFVKGYYIAKAEEGQGGRIAGILIADRIIGLIALIAIGTASLIYLFRTSRFVFKSDQWLVEGILTGGIALLALFVIFISLARKSSVRSRIKSIAARLFKNGFLYFIVEGVGLIAKKRRFFIAGFMLSFFMQIICLLGIIILADIGNEGIKSAITIMAVSSVVLLFGIMPVSPGNVGWTEFIAAYGWSAVGSTSGAEVFLYWRIVTIICSLPGVVFYARQR